MRPSGTRENPSRGGAARPRRSPVSFGGRRSEPLSSCPSPAPVRAPERSAEGTISPGPRLPSAWFSGAPTPRPRTATPEATTTATTTSRDSASPTSAAPAAPSMAISPSSRRPSGSPPRPPRTAPPALARASGPVSYTPASGPRPGYYEVRLNPSQPDSVRAELTATTRTGLARLTFPRSRHASVLVNAGGSARADDLAGVHVYPARREITGVASSGYLCAQRPRYKVYLSARFNRGFSAFGTWRRQTLDPGANSATDRKRPSTVASKTAQAGAYATFDTTRNRVVKVRVGVSFVSVAGARRNLAAEDRSFDFGRIAAAAARRWNAVLARIDVSGGKAPQPADLLHGALPRGAGASHLQRHRRALPRHGRPDPRRRPPAPSTPISPAGTSTAARSSCSPSWPRTALPTSSTRCSPTPSRAAACRAGHTPTGRA